MNGGGPMDLETRLRAAGRATAEAPRPQALDGARRAARLALAGPGGPAAVFARRHAMWRVVMALVVTLPVPLLWLWLDWSTVLAVLDLFAPPAASRVGAGLYLWFRVSVLAFAYAILAPMFFSLAVRVRAARESTA